MTFLNSIVQGCSDASGYFYSIYLKVYGWIYPFYLAAPFFYSISVVFADIAWGFYYFNTWVDDAAIKLSQIISISAITSYFQTWINYATSAYNWIINAANIITLNVTAWWNTTWVWLQPWIDQRIRELAIAGIDISDTVLGWIADARSWTTTQLNNLQNTFNVLISGVQSWTTIQINNFKSTILATIGDLTLWTSTEINTIKNLIGAIIDWDAFTRWISSWWTEKLLDIKALFNSWVLELAPVLAGWQEIRDKVFDFFDDPLEWLLAEFTDWFLGKE